MYPFHEMVNTIQVDDTDIDFFFDHSVIDTMNKLFSKYIYFVESLPLIAFDHKPPIMYIYEKCEKGKEETLRHKGEWKIFPQEKITLLLCRLQCKISQKLFEWKKQAKFKDSSEYKQTILYDKAFSKLMAPDFNSETTKKNYYKLIYHNLKKSRVTELEIDFN